MHIIIGVLTAIAGLFYAITALKNSGAIDSLNPFLWYRRAQWRKKFANKPIYALSEPIDVAGLLIVGVAKLEGELSKEQKQEILQVFENEFHLSDTEARHLFKSSSFHLKDVDITPKDIDNIFERSQSKFSAQQASSMISMMQRISKVDSEINVEQKRLVAETERYFQSLGNQKSW